MALCNNYSIVNTFSLNFLLVLICCIILVPAHTPLENILQPSNSILLPAQTGNQPDLFSINSTSTHNVPIGSTWTNSGKIAIDLDNLLSGKSKLSGPAPSMNQLKIQSPVKSSATSIPPPFQANLIGAPTAAATPSALSAKPQYSNIPTINNAQNALSSSSSNNSAAAQLPMFGNLVSLTPSSNQINLNNQFNAFQ